MLSQEEAARLLGMKTREVVDVVRTEDGYVVQLHDDTVVPLPFATGGVIHPSNVIDDSVPALLSEGGYLTDTPIPPELAETLNKAVTDALVADVPEGTVDEVLAWVDGDQDRALQAFGVEQEREKPRSTLLAKLEELVSA